MLRVLREIDEGRGEVRTRDVVRAVREVLPSDLSSNPARSRPVREIRRSDDGPVDPTRRDEPLHPSKVRIGLSPNPADEIDQNPRPSPSDRGDAPDDETPYPAFLHRVAVCAR